MDTSVKFPPATSAAVGNPLGAFASKATIEATGKQIEKFPLLKEHMAAGATVFIALIEAQDLEAQINAAAELRRLGFEPVPHIPARFVRDEADLEARLTAFRDKAGVTTVLALGGGAPEPIGKFDSAIQMMNTGLFQKAGITRIGIAGHPEGNPDITKKLGEAALMQALTEKNAWLKANGIGGFIATQFLFEAGPLALWAASLRQAGIDLPIYGRARTGDDQDAGEICSHVWRGQSACFIRKQALNITKLLSVSEPTEFVDQLAKLHFDKPELNIAAPHSIPSAASTSSSTGRSAYRLADTADQTKTPPGRAAFFVVRGRASARFRKDPDFRTLARGLAQEVPRVLREAAEDIDVDDVVLDDVQQRGDFSEPHAAHGARRIVAVCEVDGGTLHHHLTHAFAFQADDSTHVRDIDGERVNASEVLRQLVSHFLCLGAGQVMSHWSGESQNTRTSPHVAVVRGCFGRSTPSADFAVAMNLRSAAEPRRRIMPRSLISRIDT